MDITELDAIEAEDGMTSGEKTAVIAALREALDEAIRHKVELDDLRRQAKAERDEARAEVERLREQRDAAEATDGPTWDVIALRSAVVSLTEERDSLRAEVERVEAGREVERTMLRNAAEEIGRLRAERDSDRQYQIVAEMQREAEAAIARVRALCEYVDILDASEYDAGRMAALDAARAALDGEA